MWTFSSLYGRENRHGHEIQMAKGIMHKNNNTSTSKAKARKWFVAICAPLTPSLTFLSACILGPDSQREIQFLWTAPCCPDRIYHLELVQQPERQCTVDTSWTAPVTHTRTQQCTHTYPQRCSHAHTQILIRLLILHPCTGNCSEWNIHTI